MRKEISTILMIDKRPLLFRKNLALIFQTKELKERDPDIESLLRVFKEEAFGAEIINCNYYRSFIEKINKVDFLDTRVYFFSLKNQDQVIISLW